MVAVTRSESLAGGKDVKQAGREGGDGDMQFQVDAWKPASPAKKSMRVMMSACGCQLSNAESAEQMPVPQMSSLAVRTLAAD